MYSLTNRLKVGTSLAALIATTPVVYSGAASAQSANSNTLPIEEVVVTGTSIRGVAPVGSNLITMSTQEIANTGAQEVTQILAAVPSIEGFGNSGRATANSSNGGPGVAIYIHQLGANGSGSTLVLVDGHRVTQSGVTNYFVDPNIVPSIMIDRVDVLAEGASAVYGSDAVAGVVNFITRKNFTGLKLQAQASYAAGTTSYNFGGLAGTSWEGGSLLFGGSYLHETQLKNISRPWTSPLAQPARAAAAGISGVNPTNFGNFNCDPASIQPNGSGNIYYNAQNAGNVANAAANQVCSNWAYGAILPDSIRENVMAKVTQKIGSHLVIGLDLVGYERNSNQQQSRGTLTATAYGAGAQANPFYINPPGVTATKQTIRYDFDQLLGPGAISTGVDDVIWASFNAAYNVDNNWEIDFLATTGRDDNSSGTSTGTVNGPGALLALNGTVQTSASTTATGIPGYNTITLNLPLTTLNALDVWNPAASNKTSAAVIQSILNNNSTTHGVYSLVDYKMTAQGTLFALPAGDLKLAVGLEQLNTHILEYGTKAGGAAPTNVDSQYFQYGFFRKDTAEFVEADFPIISESMNIPLVEKFEINLAVRHDDYSDFGATTNPKGSFNWDVGYGVRLRGNMSTSFVAPPLNLVGGKAGLANFSSVSGATSGPGPVSPQYYPLITSFGIAGCTTASTSCQTNTLQGITRSVGDPNSTSQKGRGYSVGIDFTPEFLPGFFAAVTYWDVELLGGMTGPPFSIIVTNPTLIQNVQFYPTCATQAQVTSFATSLGGVPIPQNSVFPACVQFTSQGLTANYYYLYAGGLDVQLNYRLETDDFGTFTIGDNLTQTLKFDDAYSYHQTPSANQIFSTLNTDGINTAFPTLATSMRGHLGWADMGILADLYVNYSGAYRNVSSSAANPIINNAFNVFSGQGGDHVNANVTFDAHLAYNFHSGILGDTGSEQVSVTVNNLFDKLPPYFNSSSGYDGSVGNPIGRTITIGLKDDF